MANKQDLKEVGGTESWDTTGTACKRLNVCSKTLYAWEKTGKIEGFQTPGDKWRWNVDGFLTRQLAQRRGGQQAKAA